MAKYLFRCLMALSLLLPAVSAKSLLHSPQRGRSLVARQNGGNDTTQNHPTCACACNPIGDAVNACSAANSTDIFCGCDAYIQSAPPCVACTSTTSDSFTDVAYVQIARALCLCPDVCQGIAEATAICEVGPAGAPCFCPTLLSNDSTACLQCVHKKDPFVGAIYDNFVHSCQIGANFENSKVSEIHMLNV
jgi:hypothetical protein